MNTHTHRPSTLLLVTLALATLMLPCNFDNASAASKSHGPSVLSDAGAESRSEPKPEPPKIDSAHARHPSLTPTLARCASAAYHALAAEEERLRGSGLSGEVLSEKLAALKERTVGNAALSLRCGGVP